MDSDSYSYNKMSEDVVDVLCKKTQSNSPLFYRILVGYNFCKAASMMRAKIRTKDRGDIPINLYAVNLAESGAGKGHSTNIMEDDVMRMFKERFLSETFPIVSEQHMAKMAVKPIDYGSIRASLKNRWWFLKRRQVLQELPDVVAVMRHKS